MSTQQPTDTSMIVTPRQEYLQRVRDEMAPGEQPAAIVPRTFAEVMTMCQALASASIAPKHLRGNPVEMAMVVMTGLEVGLPPMASLRLYTTWDGVPRLMAEGVRAIILMRSTTIEYFEMATCSDVEATWIGKRRGRPEKSVTWTIERAKRAGLLSKDTWQKYPQDLLNARASMQLGRIIAPDVVAGMVALEEARDGDFVDAQSVEGKPVFVAPPPPQGPPAGVPHPVTGSTAIRQLVTDIERAAPGAAPGAVQAVTVTPTGIQPSVPVVEQVVHRSTTVVSQTGGVTVTPTGTQPSESPRRGPGRPRSQPAQPAPSPASSPTPGTDPFRAAREAVDQRAAEHGKANLATEIKKVEELQDAAIAAAVVERDKWGQSVADPTSGGGQSAPPASNEASSTPSEGSSTSSTSTADDFGGSEDPVDSQPAPTGDPGLTLIADLQTFLAGCKTQTEMQNGRPPFAQRSTALFDAGDGRFKSASNSGPAGELAAQLGQLWADRKRQLPV